MTFPISLPDWMPWWVSIVVMVPALLYLAIFLLMPFSVFGVRARLEAIEARLDELSEQLRGAPEGIPEDEGPPPPPASFRPDPRRRPPPPPPVPLPPAPPPRPERTEPRLGWPR